MSQADTDTSHPSPEQLRAFNLGRLDDEQALAIGTHLESCPECCQTLAALPAGDPFVSRVRAAADSSAPGSTAPAAARLPERLGDYALVREIGRGGMGVVYEAQQRTLGRRVALKVLSINPLTQSATLERFRRESRLAARLHHTNIVPVFEVGQAGDVCFYAMQFIPGQSLDRVVARLRLLLTPDAAIGGTSGEALEHTARTLCIHPEQPPPSPGEDTGPVPASAEAPTSASRLDYDAIARVGLQAAQALAYAHARGVLHRDVKPSNLLLDDSGVVWVTDFGLAKAEDDGLTQSGDLLGTLRYMAPERFGGACDARADVYGLGLTLYELLTLRPAFPESDRTRLLDRVHYAQPPRPRSLDPHIPRDLETVVLKAMDKDPARRYRSAAEMADDLQRFLDRRPTLARPLGTVERLGRWARRHPAVTGLLGAVAAVLLLGIAVSSYFAVQASRRAAQAQAAEGRAEESEVAARQQSAALLLGRGLTRARTGKIDEALHWMLASLEASPDPDFQRLVRTHLADWSGRIPTLRCWVDTPHREVALSPDGRRLATAGPRSVGPADRLVTLQFWDARDGRPEGDPICTRDLGMQSLSFSPDGRTLLAASGTIQEYQYRPGWTSRWDVASRKLLGKSAGHASCVSFAAWAPDGKRFLSGGWGKTLRIWDAEGKPLGGPTALRGNESATAFSPDGRTVIGVSTEHYRVWDIETRKELERRTSPLPVEVASVAFSPDGKTLLLGGGPPHRPVVTVVGWDPAQQCPAGQPRSAPYPTSRPAFLPDGRVAPCTAGRVSRDGSRFVRLADGVQVWESAQDRSRSAGDLSALTRTPGAVPAFTGIRFSADRRRFWGAGAAYRAQLWDVATGRPLGLPVPDSSVSSRTRMVVSPDGRLVANILPFSPSWLAPVQVWDVATVRPLFPRPLPQQNAIMRMAFSPDGRVLATGGHYHTVDLWDVKTGKPLGPSLPQGQMVLDLCFSPDGKTVAVGTWGSEARLWNVASRKLVATLPHPAFVGRTVFSPDGTRLLTMCPDDARLWDTRTGRPLGNPMAYRPALDRDNLRGVFSPDGKVVLLHSGFRSFRLWDAASAQPLGPPTPEGEPEAPPCFAFSPDSRLVVAGHDDGSAEVWQVATTRPLGAPVAGVLPIRGVAWVADGRSFHTVGADGMVRTWPLPASPAPLDGDVERLGHALRLATGLRLDAGQSVVPLTRQDWQEERRRWRDREGEADWALTRPISQRDWHQARAQDAEEAGAGFTARWHLDRLIARAPGDWLLRARRARTYTDEGRPDLAEADYDQAARLGAGTALTEWFRHRAWLCRFRSRPTAALWYLDRLLRDQPGAADLLRARKEVADSLRTEKQRKF
jgi:WD40 repeat protein/serine/threonine protein kinase